MLSAYTLSKCFYPGQKKYNERKLYFPELYFEVHWSDPVGIGHGIEEHGFYSDRCLTTEVSICLISSFLLCRAYFRKFCFLEKVGPGAMEP